jgi:tetratricopeptide (TPR) repeat protein
MDHPNIARVVDGGATKAGRPFFVMELVRGVKITEYCDRNNVDLRQRLHLFIQICHALQHAHQKGIIHRDIKPSNILVTLHDGAPVPKVIDFGIAKATQGRLTDQTFFTPHAQLIGTPAYMSPEQAELSGLDVDTRSDVYSLGVLLYELLTGRTPFDGKELVRSGLDELRRTLREKEPTRPSTILTTLHGTELRATAASRHSEAPKLISLMRGDLDWIVMKTLEKDRQRRYQTANALAMDIQRYLDNEPVLARPPSQVYRFHKLVRRNKVVFAAGAAAALALIAGLGVATRAYFQEREAKREQALLRTKAEEAEARETQLRRQAEAREKINQAAIYVGQEKYEQAAHLLDELTSPPDRPSFDGVEALRQVGKWLALQGRWREAADRFSQLMEIDQLDEWGVVTLDYQACGAALAELPDWGRYRRFCQASVSRFSGTTNGDAAARIVKTCLLAPPDPRLMEALRPMAAVAVGYFEPMPTNNFPLWAAIPMSLWKYRCADPDGAFIWCSRCLPGTESVPALNSSLRVIEAMALSQKGQTEAARGQLAQARQMIDANWPAGQDRGDAAHGYWFDWVFARVLWREATTALDGRIQGPNHGD